MAYTVEANSIVEAWIKTLAKVYHHGVDLPTEYKNNARTLLDPIAVHINKPWTYPQICDDISPIKSHIIEDYRRAFLRVAKTGHTYTYPNRLFDFPITKKVKVAGREGLGGYHWEDDIVTVGDGDGKGINQIQLIIDALAKSRISRRQVAHTWNPATDPNMEHCPCLQDVHFSIVYDKLRLVAHFRSNDMLDGALSNNNGLHGLQMFVANSLGVECGYLEVYSEFPHIYENRLDDAKKVLAGANKYLAYAELVRMYED